MYENQRRLARDAMTKLEQYANVRDRATDHELRTITLTDDEALALLLHVEALAQWIPATSADVGPDRWGIQP